jgi:hypothetical protein
VSRRRRVNEEGKEGLNTESCQSHFRMGWEKRENNGGNEPNRYTVRIYRNVRTTPPYNKYILMKMLKREQRKVETE